MNGCLEGHQTEADFNWATWLMETILAGEIAERLPGVKLAWNAKTRQFDHAEANAFLSGAYRKGWEIPGL